MHVNTIAYQMSIDAPPLLVYKVRNMETNKMDIQERWELPVERLRDGFYSAKYFVRAQQILRTAGHAPEVLMQVFQRSENTVLCGMEETLAVLKSCAGHRSADGGWVSAWSELSVHALNDGDTVSPWETVLTIEGDYAEFAHLESVYLGILADRSGVATKTRRVVEAAESRPVLFMGDRFKDFRTQVGDGYAVHVGGTAGVCTDAHAFASGGAAGGTMPHALIAAHDGDTVAAARAFAQTFPDVPVVALTDYQNDVVATSLACAEALGERLWGVRVDTSGNMIDAYLRHNPPAGVPETALYGVNRYLCEALRAELNAGGFAQVQIVASGGMTPEKIATLRHTVDVFGVGSSLLKGGIDYTADIVQVNGEPQSKIGREYHPNPRMRKVA